MKRQATWVPALAAPVTVLVHILSEAFATGRDILAVAWQPSHLALLLIAVAAMPLWFRAAGGRRLSQAMAAFIALSLLADGNQLGAGTLLCAILLSLLAGWLAGVAIQRAAEPPPARTERTERSLPAPPHGTVLSGPYYAFIPARGSRPPPLR